MISRKQFHNLTKNHVPYILTKHIQTFQSNLSNTTKSVIMKKSGGDRLGHAAYAEVNDGLQLWIRSENI